MGGEGGAGQIRFSWVENADSTAACRRIYRQAGVEIDLADLPLDDARTFEMLSKGDTVGVFQLDQVACVMCFEALSPTGSAIIAVVALYRPGPMENIKDYVARKHNPNEISYMHPDLEAVLAETYGIMIYQEQVQQAAQVLAGYLWVERIFCAARWAKIQSRWTSNSRFLLVARMDSLSEELASDVFDQISAFAGYGLTSRMLQPTR